MKIALGTNLFGNYQRQELAKESYRRLASKYPNVHIYDIQFKDEIDTYEISEGFITSFKLNRSSRDVIPGHEKKLPFVNDIFQVLADTDHDYFVFSNSDVMLSNRIIDFILEKEPTAFPGSRLDVRPIKNIDEPMIPVRWEIGGFDIFAMKTDWYRQHYWLFEDFLLGCCWWDHHFAGLLKIFGNNDPIANKNPAFGLHVHHGWGSGVENPGNKFNADNFNNSKFNQFRHVWDDYFAQILKVRRTPDFLFLNEYENEAETEREFFQKRIDEMKDLITKTREDWQHACSLL